MNVLGQHLILDVTLNEEITEFMINSILELVRKRLNVIKEVAHQFQPYGLTHVYILSESHFSLHTYPEHNYLSMDLYICNESFDILSFERELQSILNIKDKQSQVFLRGRINSDISEILPQFTGTEC